MTTQYLQLWKKKEKKNCATLNAYRFWFPDIESMLVKDKERPHKIKKMAEKILQTSNLYKYHLHDNSAYIQGGLTSKI